MKKNFPMEDELDPLEEWVDALRPRHPDEPQREKIKPEMHVCILLDKRKMANSSGEDPIAGGMVYEYYKMSNCGLLSYFVVDEKYRGLSIGEYLVKEAYSRCKSVAERFLCQDNKKLIQFRSSVIIESLQQCMQNNSTAAAGFSIQFLSMLLPYIFETDNKYREFFTFFAETNCLECNDGVLSSAHRHKIMSKIGFRMLDFDYIQPPLSEGLDPCADLLLLTLDNNTIPVSKKSNQRYIPTITPMLFLLEFAYSISTVTSVRSFIEQPYFTHVMNDLSKRGPRLFLQQLPWRRRTNFQVISRKNCANGAGASASAGAGAGAVTANGAASATTTTSASAAEHVAAKTLQSKL